jgi:hypothetical protein
VRSVIETLDGWVPCDFPAKAMRWMPPEQAGPVRAAHEAEALEAAIRCGAAVREDVEVRG